MVNSAAGDPTMLIRKYTDLLVLFCYHAHGDSFPSFFLNQTKTDNKNIRIIDFFSNVIFQLEWFYYITILFWKHVKSITKVMKGSAADTAPSDSKMV